MPDAEWESRLVALGGHVERHGRRLDQAETVLGLLSQHVAELDQAVRGAEAEPPAVRAWLLVADPDQAREDLADLIDWLHRVYLRYPGAALPSCWAWHPAVVEELWWLRRAHHDTYQGPHASYARATDWHERHRPGVTKRVQHWLRDCDLAQHDQDQPARAVPLAGSADRIALAWADTRSAPAPTAAELADADRHDRAEHRSHRR